MFKVKVTSMLCLEAFHSYGLRWWLFVCWVFFGWVGFAVISEGDERQNKQRATEEDLKITRDWLFFFSQVDTTAAEGLPGPDTNRGEEVKKAFSAF